jgi:hypothetical protein
MIKMTELKLLESPYVIETANLRQAVEWITFGLKPIPQKYEAIFRKVEEIQTSDNKEIDNAKRLLVLALIEDRIFAKGEMISSDRFHEYRHPCWHALSRFNWDFNQIQWDKNEIFCPKQNNTTYGNITFKFNDLVRTFPKFYDLEISQLMNKMKLESNQNENQDHPQKQDQVINIRSNYLSPYMKLLNLAVTEFNITDINQPATKILIDWFYEKLEKMQGERYLSMAKAKMLATFVREPEAQKGGLKKLKKNNP